MVGDGAKTFFWTDWWVGDTPLNVSFPLLFAISSNPNILVADAFEGEGIRFRRTFDQVCTA